MSAEVKASVKSIRVGAQKARRVADLVRGKKVSAALKDLVFRKQKTARIMEKLLNSAIAHAEEKKTVDVDNLYIKTVRVDQGPCLKRYRPRAQGRASEIRKKTSHIHVVLKEK